MRAVLGFEVHNLKKVRKDVKVTVPCVTQQEKNRQKGDGGIFRV